MAPLSSDMLLSFQAPYGGAVVTKLKLEPNSVRSQGGPLVPANHVSHSMSHVICDDELLDGLILGAMKHGNDFGQLRDHD